MFNSRCIQADVTCVQIFNNYLATGVGGFLHIYELPTNNLILKEEIFKGQNIFGIIPDTQASKFIVYGGKNISLVSFDSRDLTLKKSINYQNLSDWVLDAKWIENNTKIATVFMHNKITVWSEKFIKEISIRCEERCILYSAHICNNYYNQLLILSGTVFSEILLWKPVYANEDGLSPVLKRLKQHKGVIFSIDCNVESGLICSGSDDRSAVLWKLTNPEMLLNINPTNSDTVRVNIACQVYGHQSRVFRCLILKDFFITAGEDSLLIMWNFVGMMLRKIDSHQGGPVWSLCYHNVNDIICSGGNDGAVSTFKAHPRVGKEAISLPAPECPKIIGILKTGNIVCLSERAVLYHYSLSEKWREITRYVDLQKYSILQISPCKKMVALAGYEGQIYIYSETKGNLELLHTYVLKFQSRIFSFHWIDCKTFLVCQNDGLMSLFFIDKQKVNFIQTFSLPPIKERWSTCACALNDHIIVGDRKGNIHNFKIGNPFAVNSIKKAHNYLGVTNVYLENSVVVSLGRDGFVKRHKLLNGYLECISSNKTRFSWLTAVDHNYLLSFSGDNFVISDFKFQRVLFEAPCGGGHRSWDYLMLSGSVIISFVKQKVIHTIKLDLDDFTLKDVIEAYHVYEINSLKPLNVRGNHVIISGGEDTILRISLQKVNHIKVLQCMKTHLSSIRAIHLHPLSETLNEYLLFTAGGRAQIICWHLQVQGDLKVSCTEKCNFYEPLDRDDAETRIMDLSTAIFNGQMFLFAGCSDGFIKVFLISEDMSLSFQKNVLHSRHSISNIVKFTATNVELLGSMATDGNLIFWSIEDICKSSKPVSLNSFKIHQSGITSCSCIIKGENMIFLTGGDDNCIKLTLFLLNKTENTITISRVSTFEDQGTHCAQITGAYFCDNYFVTSSIDQRVVVSKWTCKEGQVKFEILEKYDTSIADPQGLEALKNDNNLSLYIYGNGVEHLEVKLNES